MSDRKENPLDETCFSSGELVIEAHDGQTRPVEQASKTGESRPKARRASWARRAVAAAACLVIAVGVGLFAFAQSHDTEVLNGSEEEAATGEREALVEAKAVSADIAGMADEAGADAEVTYEATGDVMLSAMAASADASSPLAAGSIAVGTGDFDEAEGESGLLTAAEWNDNDNWPFFTNLVNAATISFPSFGIDPRHRVKVAVTDGSGTALRGERVVLRDAGGAELWHATTGKNGAAYLFYRDGEEPAAVAVPAAGAEQAVTAEKPGQQGAALAKPIDDVTISIGAPTASSSGDLQVMFIVDTTGSMSDEIAYLQADFSSIAAEVGSAGVSYSVNFYRDEGEDEEYVTKCNPFTDDVSTVQRQIDREYADGGGDEPEAVAQILTETITDNSSWRDDASKIAFLVFDAPPHEGTDEALAAAVRSAAERGIGIVPVVASNASRDTELFGRALAICTGASYVFLTDDSGIGDAHLEPIVGDYTVENLHDVIVRLIREAR